MLDPQILLNRLARCPQSVQLYHLSHNDLDGYGAQFITHQLMPGATFANTNYGAEILTQMRGLRAQFDRAGDARPALFLVTDVNLTLDTARDIEALLADCADVAGLLLLDHHAKGAHTAAQFEWYHLDPEHCATALTWQAFAALADPRQAESLALFARHVQAHDLWLEADPCFNAANWLAEAVLNLRDYVPEALPDLARVFRFHLLECATARLQAGDVAYDLDRRMFNFREAFLIEQNLSQAVRGDATLAQRQKYYHLVGEYLQVHWHREVQTFNLEGLRGGLLYAYPKGLFQTVSNWLLTRTPELDFFVNITPMGFLSMRSREADVAVLAKRFFGGNGHPRAAGGNLNGVYRTREGAAKAFFKKIGTPQAA